MFGYEWGDILLRNIANKLNAMIRKEDILTRYGDEEFLLVLPNTSEENAFLFGERFRREVEKMEFIPAVKKKHTKLQFPAEFRHTRACRMLMKMQTLL